MQFYYADCFLFFLFNVYISIKSEIFSKFAYKTKREFLYTNNRYRVNRNYYVL